MKSTFYAVDTRGKVSDTGIRRYLSNGMMIPLLQLDSKLQNPRRFQPMVWCKFVQLVVDQSASQNQDDFCSLSAVAEHHLLNHFRLSCGRSFVIGISIMSTFTKLLIFNGIHKKIPISGPH